MLGGCGWGELPTCQRLQRREVSETSDLCAGEGPWRLANQGGVERLLQRKKTAAKEAGQRSRAQWVPKPLLSGSVPTPSVLLHKLAEGSLLVPSL